jgi:pimeloyl-ACP methyl ester carboxylesterase
VTADQVAGQAAGLAYRLDRVPGSPVTVVLENAMVCSTTEWAWVREHLRGTVSTLAYDRAGIGASRRPPRRLTAAAKVAELRELQQALGLTPPYVLVGHSVGGLLCRSYAWRHRAEVAGVVLVDSSDPSQASGWDQDALRGHVSFGHRLLVLAALSAAGRHGRLDGVLPDLPAAERARAVAELRRPAMHLACAAELRAYRRDWCADAARWDASADPGPAVFLSAGETLTGNPKHARRQQAVIDAVPGARHVVVDGADHETIVTDPGHSTAVATEILAVAGLTAGSAR